MSSLLTSVVVTSHEPAMKRSLGGVLCILIGILGISIGIHSNGIMIGYGIRVGGNAHLP